MKSLSMIHIRLNLIAQAIGLVFHLLSMLVFKLITFDDSHDGNCPTWTHNAGI